MIFMIAKIKGFPAPVIGVQLSYLQIDKPLIRKIFITSTAPELELSPDYCLGLQKFIHGLADRRPMASNPALPLKELTLNEANDE